jgi:hypothetical protein
MMRCTTYRDCDSQKRMEYLEFKTGRYYVGGNKKRETFIRHITAITPNAVFADDIQYRDYCLSDGKSICFESAARSRSVTGLSAKPLRMRSTDATTNPTAPCHLDWRSLDLGRLDPHR